MGIEPDVASLKFTSPEQVKFLLTGHSWSLQQLELATMQQLEIAYFRPHCRT